MRTDGNRSNLIAFPNFDSALFKEVMKFIVRFLEIFVLNFFYFYLVSRIGVDSFNGKTRF